MVRAIILAALGLALLGATKADPPKKAEINNQAAEQRQQAPPPPAPAAPDRRESYRPHADYNQDDCYRNADHEAADLCAQWRAALAAEKAAEWARRGVFVAVGGAFLSFFSIILVLMALRQGRDANRLNMKEAARNSRRTVAGARDTEAALAIAARNADTAMAQVDLAQETARRQLRAYVAIFAAKHETKVGEKVLVHLTVKNAGQTPAIKFTGAARVTVAPRGLTMKHPDDIKGFPESVVGAGGKSTLHGTTNAEIDDEILEGLRSGKYAIFCDGEITYSDVFGGQHWLKFCLISDLPFHLATFSPVGDAIISDDG